MPFLQNLSIKSKLILIGLLTTVIVLTLANTALIINYYFTLRNDLINDLTVQAQIIGDNSTAAISFDDKKAAKEILSALKAAPNIVRAAIFNKDGTVFETLNNKDLSAVVLPKAHEKAYNIGFNNLDVFKYMVLRGELVGTIYIQSNLDKLYTSLLWYARINIIVTIISLSIAYLILLKFQQSITKPIIKLRNATKEIGKGSLDVRIDINSNDEIGQLSEAFNKMAADLSVTTTSIKNLNQEKAERKRIEVIIKGLNSLNEKLLGFGSLDDKLKCITDGIVEFFNADFARIWRTKPGDHCYSGCIHAEVTEGPHVCVERDCCLHLMASSGRYTHIDGKVHARVPFGCYKIGRIASGQASKLLTNDVIHDSSVHNHEWAKKLGLVSFAGYRLASESEKPIGVMSLFSKHIISPEEDNLLKGLAGTCTHVIQSADVTKSLLQSEKLKSIGTITAGISHEFNNILAIISGMVHLLESKYSDHKELTAWLSTIKQATVDGAQISRSMLKSTRPGIDSKEFIAHDINILVKESIEFTKPRWKNMAQADAIEYHVDAVIREIPPILCSPAAIREIFINIINNALDAMPDGGTITMATRCVRSKEPGAESKEENTSELKGDLIEITIADTGKGMPEEVMKSVFDPFFTTRRPEGTGLGMSIVYSAIKSHGGKINVDSEVGKGSTFTLQFPVASQTAGSIMTPEPGQEIKSGNLSILVVDDEKAICEILDNVLSERGYEVRTVSNGGEAIELSKREAFDLVLCDLAMPGVHGYDVIKAFSNLEKRPKIGIITGLEEKLKSIDNEDFEVDFIIKKPFDLSELARNINDAFDT